MVYGIPCFECGTLVAFIDPPLYVTGHYSYFPECVLCKTCKKCREELKLRMGFPDYGPNEEGIMN